MVKGIKAWISAQSAGMKIAAAFALIVLLSIGWWFYGAQVWNGIGNKVFEWKIGKKQEQVNKELADAAEQKKILEQTLFEYAQSKKELEAVKAEKDRLEQVFNDKSKTASEKVAEFKKIAGSEPEHTATDGVTLNELCERAKAAGASQSTINSLCGF